MITCTTAANSLADKVEIPAYTSKIKETKDPNLMITVPKMRMDQVMKEQCTNPQKWSMIKCGITANTMLDKGETQVDIPNPVRVAKGMGDPDRAIGANEQHEHVSSVS
jgi:hypothetical protein